MSVWLLAMVQLAGDEQFCFLLLPPGARGKQTPASRVFPCGFVGWALPHCQRFPNFGFLCLEWKGSTQAWKREAIFKAHGENSINLPNTCLKGQPRTLTKVELLFLKKCDKNTQTNPRFLKKYAVQTVHNQPRRPSEPI